MLYHADPANRASLSSAAEHDRATAQVLGRRFGEFGVKDMVGDRLLFINATRSFFTGQLPLPFESDNMVLSAAATASAGRQTFVSVCSANVACADNFLLRSQVRVFRSGCGSVVIDAVNAAFIASAPYLPSDGPRLPGGCEGSFWLYPSNQGS